MLCPATHTGMGGETLNRLVGGGLRSVAGDLHPRAQRNVGKRGANIIMQPEMSTRVR